MMAASRHVLLLSLLAVSVATGVRVGQRCLLEMEVQCPDDGVPAVTCNTRCTVSKKRTWFVGSLYQRVECLEAAELMVKVEYHKGSVLSCSLVAAMNSSRLLEEYLKARDSRCVTTAAPSPATTTTTLVHPPSTSDTTSATITTSTPTAIASPTTLSLNTTAATATTTTGDTTRHTTTPATTPTTKPTTTATSPTTMTTTIPTTTITSTITTSTTTPTTMTIPTTTATTATTTPLSTTTTTTPTTTITTTPTTTTPTTTTTTTTSTTTTTTPTTTTPTTTTTSTTTTTTPTTTTPTTTTTTSTTTTTTPTTTTPTTTTTSTTTTNRLPVCGVGWTQYGVECFSVSGVKGSWREGVHYCSTLGGTLASITSDQQHHFVVGLLTDSVWIGLNDIAQEGKFVWTDGNPTTYTNFDDGEPNNGWWSEENCVEMRRGFSYKWNDEGCSTNNLFLCHTDAE